jgi:hypothetical protein
MTIDDYSLKMTKKKAIGGLVTSAVKGTFIHFNTIEEYEAADVNKIVNEIAESTGILEAVNENNRFVVLAFGDLKNYLYHHR